MTSYGGRAVSTTSMDAGFQPEYLGDLFSLAAGGTPRWVRRAVSADVGGRSSAAQRLLAEQWATSHRSHSHSSDPRGVRAALAATGPLSKLGEESVGGSSGGASSGQWPDSGNTHRDAETAALIARASSSTKRDRDAAKRRKTLSFRCLYFVAFLSSVGFSILLPTLWPRMKADGESKLFYGIVLSAYCAGQIIGSVSLGAAAPRWGFRATLWVSLAVEFIGYVVYSLTADAYVILVSRLVAGIGAGNISISRAFIAQHVEPSNRAGGLAAVTAAQALGFVTGPLVASLVGATHVGVGHFPFRFDVTTVPSYFAALLCVLNAAAVGIYFTEHLSAATPQPLVVAAAHSDKGGVDGPAPQSNGGARRASAGGKPGQAECFCCSGLFVCAVLFMMELMVFSLGETALVPLTMQYYGWSVTSNGGLWAAVSGSATVSFVLVRLTARWFRSSLHMFAAGIALAVVCLLALAPWSVVSSGLPTHVAVGGGDAIPSWRLVMFMCLLLGVAHPFAFVAMMTTYSNLVPAGKQSSYMGYLQAAGSLGRIIGPVYSGQLLSLRRQIAYGSFWLFVATAALLAAGVAVMVCVRGRLVPKPQPLADDIDGSP